MTTTYTWNIKAVDCYPEVEGEANVVFTAHWVLCASNGNYSANTYGAQALTREAGTPFTPYSQLTESKIAGWVQDAMGAEEVANLKASLDSQIANQAAPKTVQPVLPWATAASPDEFI